MSRGRGTERHEICPAADLPPGERKIVDVDGRSIGVFNLDGEYYAVKNVCPHQLAPLCEGQVSGTVTGEEVGEYEYVRDGEILRCPWHGWEFDIKTGRSLFNPHGVRTKSYEAEAVEGEYGTELLGEEPPVETYDVEVEAAHDGDGSASRVVVVYV